MSEMQKSGHKRSSPSVKNQREVEEKKKKKFGCEQCEKQEDEHKKIMTKMETFYKEELNNARLALKDKQDELKSLKDRLACEVTTSLKTGDTESMNNPASKSRLTDIYNKLRLLQWPKIKDRLKSKEITTNVTKALVLKIFKDATEEMEKKKTQVEEVLGLIEPNSGLTPQKVKQYKQLAMYNLQISLYHSNKEDLVRTRLLEHEAQHPQDVMENLHRLASECYWLGCLLTLNNPPLQPDWQNHIPGMDIWDIFPPELKTSS